MDGLSAAPPPRLSKQQRRSRETAACDRATCICPTNGRRGQCMAGAPTRLVGGGRRAAASHRRTFVSGGGGGGYGRSALLEAPARCCHLPASDPVAVAFDLVAGQSLPAAHNGANRVAAVHAGHVGRAANQQPWLGTTVAGHGTAGTRNPVSAPHPLSSPPSPRISISSLPSPLFR